jgi:hypothetical protein
MNVVQGSTSTVHARAKNVKARIIKDLHVFSSVCCFLSVALLLLQTKPWIPSVSSVAQHHSSISSKTCVKSRWTPPRCFLVYDHTIFYVFEDWVEPFLYTLGMTLEMIRLSVKPEHENLTTTIQSALNAGDTVLLLQSMHGIVRKNGVEYWFLNTEGPDKGFAEHARSQGYKRIIDYSSFNVERHKLGGAETSLWLPMVGSHSITHRKVRDKLCIVGGVNTARREKFAEDFDENVRKRGMNVSIQHIVGWGHTRDYSSQACALVVNVASVENNHATPRLRLDKLWQFDIPIISEEMSGNETVEYNGTVVFVPFSELPNETLNLWELITHENYTGTTDSMRARVLVHESRMYRFQNVVQTVTRIALEAHVTNSRTSDSKS